MHIICIRFILYIWFTPVSWDGRVHRLHLCRRIKPPPYDECPGYDSKKSDSEASIMLGLLGIWSTPLMPLLLDPL